MEDRMNPDLGTVIGFIGMVGAASMLALSYFGAYFVGYNRARRELEERRREDERSGGLTARA
jgi:hypothetical protein